MRIKTYFSPNVEAALEEARKDLGPDALLMNCREAPPETAHLGAYEVTFAVRPEAPAAPTAATEPPAADSLARLASEMAALRKQVQEWGSEARRARPDSPAVSMLLDCGLEPSLAGDIGRHVAERASQEFPRPLDFRTRAAAPIPDELLRTMLAEELAARLPIADEPAPGDTPWIAALVGPPGSGKTSTLVKLAVRYGLHARRPVQVICADPCRIGAAHQLQAYAAIIGAGFQTVDLARMLRQAIEEHRQKSVILIDTPGFSPSNFEESWDLAEFFQSAPDVHPHLVLPATMKTTDLTRAIQRFSAFRPRHLLFTRTDETESMGALYSAAVESGLPLSFLGTGPAIPEHLEVPSRERIVEQLLRGAGQRAEAVA